MINEQEIIEILNSFSETFRVRPINPKIPIGKVDHIIEEYKFPKVAQAIIEKLKETERVKNVAAINGNETCSINYNKGTL